MWYQHASHILQDKVLFAYCNMLRWNVIKLKLSYSAFILSNSWYCLLLVTILCSYWAPFFFLCVFRVFYTLWLYGFTCSKLVYLFWKCLLFPCFVCLFDWFWFFSYPRQSWNSLCNQEWLWSYDIFCLTSWVLRILKHPATSWNLGIVKNISSQSGMSTLPLSIQQTWGGGGDTI